MYITGGKLLVSCAQKVFEAQQALFSQESMAKEIASSGDPSPNVFQLFNENRTFFFESDISSLPSPPCTLPSATQTLSKSIGRSQSTSDLSTAVSTTHSTSCTRPVSAVLPPMGIDLHQSTAIMAPMTSKGRFHNHDPSVKASARNPEERHYYTEPSYGSSKILKSFKNELTLFGGIARKSTSTPSSPRRESSPDLNVSGALEEYRPRTNSDSRRLSKVHEEADNDIKVSSGTRAVALLDSEESGAGRKSQNKKLLTAPALDSTGSSALGYGNMNLTTRVAQWFKTPQKDIELNKPEFNAMSPSSF